MVRCILIFLICCGLHAESAKKQLTTLSILQLELNELRSLKEKLASDETYKLEKLKASITDSINGLNTEAIKRRNAAQSMNDAIKNIEPHILDTVFLAFSGSEKKPIQDLLDSLLPLVLSVAIPMPQAAIYLEQNISAVGIAFRERTLEMIKKNLAAFFLQDSIKLPLSLLNQKLDPDRDKLLQAFDEEVEKFLIHLKTVEKPALRGKLIGQFIRDYLLIDSPNEAFSEKRSKVIAELLPQIYQNEFAQFERMIFSDLIALPETKTPLAKPTGTDRQTVCNHDGYDDNVEIECEKGAALLLDSSTPIGYNITLPSGEVQAVVTSVYGGNHKDTRINTMYKPNNLTVLEKYLLSKGVAVVTLNLIDLRELDAAQRQMSYFLHQRLHESINKFFETLRDDPTSLHQDLVNLKGKKQFLYGASFGGRTAFRQAELFPNSYDGYMSIGGALSFEHATAHYKVVDERAETLAARNWLDPILSIKLIKKPLLIIQNFDDNSVNALSAIEFYKKAREAGLGHLIELLFLPKGMAMMSGAADLPSFLQKGHHLQDKSDATMKRVIDVIMRFIASPLLSIEAFNELSAQKYDLYAYRYQRGANTLNKFLSEAIRRYDQGDAASALLNDETWKDIYAPIAQAFFILGKLDEQGKLDLSKRINDQGELIDVTIKNALKSHATLFAEYLKEKYLWKSELSVIAKDIYENTSFINEARSWLLNNDLAGKEIRHYLLEKLLVANPSLVKILNQDAQSLVCFLNARKLFEEKILQTKAIAQRAWSDAAKRMHMKIKDAFAMKIAKIASNAKTDYTYQQWLDLMHTAASLLSLQKNFVATETAKLKILMTQCKNDNELCASNYGLATLMLALILGDKNNLHIAMRDFKSLYNIYNWLSEDSEINTDVIDITTSLMNELKRHRWLTDEEIKTLFVVD